MRFNQGYFGWIKFEVKSEDIAKLKKLFDGNKALLRYILITTVKENTIASKQPLSANVVTRSSKAPKVVIEDGAPMNKEKVDEEIDKLVEDVDTSESEESTEEKASE